MLQLSSATWLQVDPAGCDWSARPRPAGGGGVGVVLGGWRGPFCKSRTSTAWECQRGGCSRCSGGRTRSKLTFRVDSVTTPETNNSQLEPSRTEPSRAGSLPETAGSRPDRPRRRASCRTLGPDTKTTARRWGGRGGRPPPARRAAAASSVSASWLRERARVCVCEEQRRRRRRRGCRAARPGRRALTGGKQLSL